MLAALLALLLAPGLTHAAQILYGADLPVHGPERLQYLRDDSGRLDLAAVRKASSRFRPVPGRIANFGFTSSTYWLRFTLTSSAARPVTVFLSINQPTIDHVHLYALANGKLAASERSGDRLPANERAIPADHPVLPIRIGPGQTEQVYVRLSGTLGALLAPMRIESAAALQRDVRRSLLFNGLMAGVFGGLILYNLFIWLALRDRTYLIYVGCLLAGFVCCMGLDGFGGWMLYPDLPWLANQGLIMAVGAAMMLHTLFTRLLLQTRTVVWLDRLLCALALGALVVLCSPLLLPQAWIYPLTLGLVVCGPLINGLTGLISLRYHHPQALLYVTSRATAWIGTFCYALSVLGVFELGSLPRDAVTLGFAVAALLLSFALADRVRSLQRATRRAEAEIRDALLLRHEELERSVEERTRELNEARRRAELLATTDALTGVLNRRGLLPLLQQVVERAARDNSALSLITFDVDHFKQINDEFGHAEGDRLLQQLAALTRSLLRSTDLVGRTGGEEFMIVLNGTCEAAMQLSERLRARAEATLSAGGRRTVTVSFGVATRDADLNATDTLQRAADAALYRSKHRGRNCVSAYGKDGATTRTRAIVRSLPLRGGVLARAARTDVTAERQAQRSADTEAGSG